jgi:hypothetical protein
VRSHFYRRDKSRRAADSNVAAQKVRAATNTVGRKVGTDCLSL